MVKPHKPLISSILRFYIYITPHSLWHNVVEESYLQISKNLYNRKKPVKLSIIFEEYLEFFDNDKPKFLSMLEQHLDIDSLIPLNFSMHFYKGTGKPMVKV